ncbi:MAG: hypothetical protein JST54_28590 [Deltaproteobacteria bacterium]|nr:hypothetical protein [Deltaproteobacteria bacterium]
MAPSLATPPLDRDEPPEPAAPALEAELERALLQLPPDAYRDLAHDLQQASLATGFTWERRDGGFDPVPLQLRPRVWTTRQCEFVRHACLTVQGALARLLPAWLDDAAVREVLPLAPYEEDRIRALARSGADLGDQNLFARLDAIIDPTSPTWDRTLAFLEPNVVGVGGVRYTALGEKLWAEVVRPRLGNAPILPPLDSRQLMLEHLQDRARGLGLRGPLRVALVEDLRDTFGTNELRLIAEYFRSQGAKAHHVDVRTLSWDGNQLLAAGQPVDLVYRFPELRELEELDVGKALHPLWQAFDANRVVSTLAGDFDHKSTFELFTSARFTSHFTDAERRVFARHVLWTRLMKERKTDGPDGAELELVPFVRRHRAELVLKPNRSYGGQGVVIGAEVNDETWDARLHEALSQPGGWVVQRFRPLPRQAFPVRRGDGWDHEELLVVCGFFATLRGVTAMGRASRAAIVNLTQRGASLVPHVRIEG